MDCSTPGFPVLRYLPELAQTHVCQVGDAIQPFHPPSSHSPPVFSLSQHQGLFQWVSFSRLVAKAFSFSISLSNEYSGLMSFRIDWFDLLVVQFKSICSLVLSLPYSPILTSMHDYWIAWAGPTKSLCITSCCSYVYQISRPSSICLIVCSV